MNNKSMVIDIETNAFSPFQGRIICIGVKDVETEEFICFQDEHEESMLVQFLGYFNKKKFLEIIGYNLPFDIRFLLGRFLHFKLPASSVYRAEHTDLMRILRGYRGFVKYDRAGTLDEWGRLLTGEGKLQLDESVPSLYRKGEIDLIKKYNQRDVELTYKIYKIVNKTFFGREIYAK
jgi:uncharacterized protein YprB with RNaseH-like and TPR domain